MGLFTATTSSVVPLLPKLRGHFAEFLNKGSPVRLRIFFSSTCVGLRYGYLEIFSSFSRRRRFKDFVSFVHSPSQLSLTTCVLHYKPASLLGRAFPSARFFYLSVSLLHLLSGSTGLSTCCPSYTPFGLYLGPDLPRADEPSPGNLRLSTAEFLAPLSLLMPAFSLLYSPRLLPVTLLPVYIAPLPIHSVYS